MSEPEFVRWFVQLTDTIEMIGNKLQVDEERLVRIHTKLIDLIDFLDPHCVRIASNLRTRIEQSSKS
jgi:hypothetical protein